MFVKICGLTSVDMLEVAVDAGADAIGVVMSARSVRNVDAPAAALLAAATPPGTESVLVTNDLDATTAASRARDLGFTILQLHGSYTAEDHAAALTIHPRVWRATSLANDPPLTVGAWGEEALLLDSPRAGSGETWDWGAVSAEGRWLLAGGLTPGTVAEAIGIARPWGVDVSSGVESAPGVKDAALIRAFVAAATA